MPELPEVETTRRGIAPHLEGRKVAAVTVRQPKLRWPVPDHLAQTLSGQQIRRVARRAKYLLIECETGTLIIHLGMSGSLRLIDGALPAAKHDHVDIQLDNGCALRLTDPRRFGSVLWQSEEDEEHPLLQQLGPEPFDTIFNGERLYQMSRGKRQAVKLFIMDNRTVVGVGNIYANEALFQAGIDPRRAAGRISQARYHLLAEKIQQVLRRAIEQGGTTLKDFVGGDGKPGYFQQQLHVYGRGGEECDQCGSMLQQVVLGQRATVFCPECQR
ncbi:bifunctional DNA-formamidopyrimidine glycosylase/DNA-(apurinic or apyrimidinic site) lyase [Motiliproteus sp.]|uniref:bifunctional DNA-formamidopyrimidine glycosylase/DNA-(apurinic or apyrimidinic site) lyase n=1 Tax=Motiliproteus sp. TaxID=1898955 RepID=UPI003BACADFC